MDASVEDTPTGGDPAADRSESNAGRVGWGTLVTLWFSFFGVGVTVSATLAERGAPTGNILIAALIIFSATSELAFIAVRDSGGTLAAALLSGWLVASRFGLLASALGTRLDTSRRRRAVAAWCAVDPNVAVAMERTTPAAVWRAYWMNTIALVFGWLVGTVTGLVLVNLVDDVAAWGLDAVFPAALLAIIGPMLRQRDGATAAIIGATICLALTQVAPGGVPILLSFVGAIIAAGLAGQSTCEVGR